MLKQQNLFNVPKNPNKKSTKTSAFGVSERTNHNADEFYSSNLYEDNKLAEPDTWLETQISSENLNQLYCKSSTDMSDIPDNSIHLMITSPPYNAKKEYDEDLSLVEYRGMLYSVFHETYKKLVTGGRACINIANLGRKPYIPLHSYIIDDMIDIGYHMRGEIIWDKGSSSGTSTAWGSWQSAANPVMRDVHEYILVFSKESFNRKNDEKENSIRKEDFLEWTKSIWTFPAISAKRIGHPAPFPEELPNRLIQLYSFVGDVILDPFCGSGTTCLSALKSHRYYIGYDIEKDYIKLATNRIKSYSDQIRIKF